MRVAAGMLSTSSASLMHVANQVGYESDITFSRAFRRWAGVPPGEYRRSAPVVANNAKVAG